MAKQTYGYSLNSVGISGGADNIYASRSIAGSYLSAGDSLRDTYARYLSSDTLSGAAAISSSRHYNFESHSAMVPGLPLTSTTLSFGPPGVDVMSTGATADLAYTGLKRTSSESWYSTNPLAKRFRYEDTSHLPIYPQRPGEMDCAYYMQTRTCKFGDSCKFDHPIWVPEGGIPDWKEVPLLPSEYLPERPCEPDCPYFLKTQKCKFGIQCKFNHPKYLINLQGAPESCDASVLPDRPSEPPCAFYMKTGQCKYGATCKFHHPKGVQIQSVGEDKGNYTMNKMAGDTNPGHLLFTPAIFHNSKGLPIRPGIEDCPFFLKTGSCKYGTSCRYNHPNRIVIDPQTAAIVPGLLSSASTPFNVGAVAPVASLLSSIDPSLTRTAIGLGSTIYPQRPGQMECDYYMKTGVCKFGDVCKFHHPIDRSATTSLEQQNVKLTLAGLPRREGAIHCPFYMKTGTCKYGSTCKFDHPPPGEVISVVTSQCLSDSAVGKEKDNGENA